MARSVNRITIVGRCGSDPEPRQLRNGMKKVEVAVATNRTRSGEETTDWFSCSFWDKVGDLAEQLLKKGDLVYVDGRMESSKYEDRNGEKRTRWEVSVSTFVPMASDNRGGSNGGGRGGGGGGGGGYSGGGGSGGGGGYGGKPQRKEPAGDSWLDDGDSKIPF